MAQGKLNTLRGWLLWVACMALTLWVGGAQAATPAANTVILNQSSMTYTDAAGAAWSTTSNTVSTTVTQVYSYTLLDASGGTTGNSKNVGPTVTAYSPYVLTNTGNGTDTFTVGVTGSISTTALYKIEIYEDDGTGNPTATAPLCSITTGTNASCTNATISLAAGAKYKFVVAYTVAGTATNNSTATSTVTAYSNTLGAATKPARTDNITVTMLPVFVSNLAIRTPTVAPPSGTWPLLTTGHGTATQPIYTTYTLAYSNIGGAQSNIYIKDVLPSGFGFVMGVSSCLSGTALNTTSGGNPSVLCSGANGTSTAIDFQVTGQTLEVVVPNVAAGTSGSLSFKVEVLSNKALFGTSNTTNQASYSASGCTGATVIACRTSTTTMTDTNTVAFNVTLRRGAQVGLADTMAGTPASAADATRSNVGVATPEMLPFTVTNTGNADDLFNVSLSTTDKQAIMNAYPSTAVLSWFADANATTPLQDTNGDGVLDTGSVAAFASKKVYLRVYVPIDTPLNPQANYEATVLATSGNDSTIKDASYADVPVVHGGKIDLSFTNPYNAATNVIGDWAPGPSSSPLTTITGVTAGATVTIPVYLTSNFDTATAISLTQGGNKEMGSLPSGWTAYWSTGACAGPTDSKTVSSSTPNPGQTLPLNLCLVTSTKEFTLPQRVYLKAYNGTVASDILYVEVAVVVKRFVLLANRTNVVKKGSSVDYAHVATNTGAVACASSSGGYMKVEAAFTDSAAATAGWSYALYLDKDNNDLLSVGDTIISDGKLTSGSLAVGASVKFLVRVYAPLTPGLATTVPLTVTVTDVDASGQASDCGSRSITDLTTLQGSPLTVLKTQATSTGTCSASFSGVTFATTPLSVAAGDCLYYQIEVTNIGPGPQSNVVVSDVASNYTTFYSSGSNATCTGASGFTGSAALAVNGDVITCGATGNSLPVGGKLTLRYAVQVKP